jgi:hypothetical protein
MKMKNEMDLKKALEALKSTRPGMSRAVDSEAEREMLKSTRPGMSRAIDSEGETDMQTKALRSALESLKNMPEGSLFTPRTVEETRMAQSGPITNEEADDAIQRLYQSEGLTDDTPAMPPLKSKAPMMEEETPVENEGIYGRLFGGKSTRQKQLDELEKKARGE